MSSNRALIVTPRWAWPKEPEIVGHWNADGSGYGVLSVKDTLTTEDIARIKARWERQYIGRANANIVVVSQEGSEAGLDAI